MNATLSTSAPSSQAMARELIEQLAELLPLKAALAELPEGRRAQKGKP
jgi:hypothetical protein